MGWNTIWFRAFVVSAFLIIVIEKAGWTAPLPWISSQEASARLAKLPKSLELSHPLDQEQPQAAQTSCTLSTQVFEFVDPFYTNPWTVRIHIYSTHKADGPTPWMLYFPPIQGIGFLDRTLSKKFCRSGLSVLVIDAEFDPHPEKNKPVEVHDQANKRTILLTHFLIDQYEKDPRFSPVKIGVFGYSLGGMLAALAHSTDPRISAAWITVGAGNLPAVLAYSTQKQVALLRAQRMAAHGLNSAAEYESLLRQVISFDPIYFAHRKPTSSVKMVVGKSDTDVPFVNQIELYDAFVDEDGRRSDSLIEVSTGHLGTILQLPIRFVGEIVQFYKQRL